MELLTALFAAFLLVTAVLFLLRTLGVFDFIVGRILAVFEGPIAPPPGQLLNPLFFSPHLGKRLAQFVECIPFPNPRTERVRMPQTLWLLARFRRFIPLRWRVAYYVDAGGEVIVRVKVVWGGEDRELYGGVGRRTPFPNEVRRLRTGIRIARMERPGKPARWVAEEETRGLPPPPSQS